MKPIGIIAVSVLLSAAIAVGASYLLLENRGESSKLSSGGDTDARLARALDRLDEVAADQAAFQERITQAMAAPDTEGIRRMRSTMELEIAGLRNELAQLSKSVAERPAGSVGSAGSQPGFENEETAAAVAALVEQQVTEQVRQSQRKQVQQWAPMVRANMSRQISQTAKKLNLDPEQTRRLEEASTAAFDKVMPSIGVMMDGNATPAEKEKAFADIDTSMADISSDAQSYMTAEQHNQFLEEQAKQQAQMERMRAMFGGGAQSGGTPTGGSRVTGGN